MNNAITYALRYIKREIPIKILNEAFLKDLPYTRGGVRNLESIMKSIIIDQIIRPDADTVGGRELKLDVEHLSPMIYENDGIALKIPMEMTNGVAITSCRWAAFMRQDLNMSGYGMTSGYTNNTMVGGSIAGVGSNIMNASSPDPITGTAECHVAPGGDNIVFVKCRNRQKIYWLMVDTAFDEMFNQIHPKSFQFFAESCLLATKAYIYTKLVVELDEGKISAGSEIGAFKNIIDGYSDANKSYNEHLRETMEVVYMLNDPRSKEEHYFFVSGGRRW